MKFATRANGGDARTQTTVPQKNSISTNTTDIRGNLNMNTTVAKRKSALLLSSIFLYAAAGVASAQTVIMQKQGTGFSIDGNRGSVQQGSQVYLWNTSSSNVNQQWIEISRGSNTFSYQKNRTSLCLDGGNGGANRQPITLQNCSSSNQNQQWRKISTGGNS